MRPTRGGTGKRVLLLTAARDWHARRLAAALRGQGAEIVTMRLEECGFATDRPSGLDLGRVRGLPDGVLVRTIAPGSFEAITRRLGILHALKAVGVPVWNEAAAVERCVDKSMTTFLLQRAGLSVPPSWTVEDMEAARAIVAREAGERPLVLKPLFGSQGRGLKLVRSPEDLPPPDAVSGVYHLQRYVGRAGPLHVDYRVFVVGGEAVAAMERHASSWITNVKQGGRPMPVQLDAELQELASRASEAVGAQFCGVDILRAEDGTAYVLEVNSMPAWSGLQTVAPFDIAGLLAERFCASIGGASQRRVA
jgi:RimK family alpha-L-glutamate ligase